MYARIHLKICTYIIVRYYEIPNRILLWISDLLKCT